MHVLLKLVREWFLVQESVGVLELFVEAILCESACESCGIGTLNEYVPICFMLLTIPFRSPFLASITNVALARRIVGGAELS